MSFVLLERLQRHSLLGMRFWDLAAATSSVGGLEVDVYPRARPRARIRAQVNLSGIYFAQNLPGLRDLEFADLEPEELWATATQPYRVEVRDPHGRFLPMAFDADLPVRGLFTWRAPWFSPPRAVSLPGEPGSPPQLLMEKIPLFSAPHRPVPEPLAVLYAQLREAGGAERPAAWALLTASIDGAVRGLGLADREGRVAVMFPYPEPPRMTLSSPPAARSDFHWQVELSAHYAVGSPQTVPEIAELGAVLAQLELPPRALLGSTLSPPQPLLPLALDYRGRLTARTEATPAGPSSFLFVSTD